MLRAEAASTAAQEISRKVRWLPINAAMRLSSVQTGVCSCTRIFRGGAAHGSAAATPAATAAAEATAPMHAHG